MSECTSCHRPCRSEAVQSVSQGELGWELNSSCLGCGIEVDDIRRGPAPQHIRGRLLAKFGGARIRVDGTGAYGGRLLKIFRDVFGGSVQDAKRAAAELTATGWRGTQVEISLVAHLLRQSEIAVVDRWDEEPTG